MKKLDFRRDLLPHKDRLYRLALGILAHTAEAEDTVEDTLIRVWEENQQHPEKEITNLPAYLSTVCRNLALDRAERLSAQFSPLDTLPEFPDDAPAQQEADNDIQARYSKTLSLIQSLREPQRSCLILRDVEGLSYQDIAETLALTEGQVKINIHRARLAVREAYDKQKNKK